MAKLKYLIIHCTATPEGKKISKADIVHWHTSPKNKGGRGWKQVGYSDMVHIDGRLENLVPFNQNHVVEGWEITNGAKGMNSASRHVVYVGGVKILENKKDYPVNPAFRTVSYDTRTDAQKSTLETYVRYMILRHPNIKVGGHNQFANKACPSFDVPDWLRSIGIAEKNINN